MGLNEGQLVNASLLDAAATVQLRIRWKRMRTPKITTYISPSAQGQCTPFSDALREAARNTEALYFIHPTIMHFNGVMALRQRINLKVKSVYFVDFFMVSSSFLVFLSDSETSQIALSL
jgi:hypothetical protein